MGWGGTDGGWGPTTEGGATGGLEYEPVVITATTPDTDPNSLWEDNLISHGNGEYTFSHNDSVQTRGPSTGWGFIVDMPTAFVNDGSYLVHMRMTLIDANPSAGLYQWYSMGVGDAAGVMTTGSATYLGIGQYFNGASTWVQQTVTRTSITSLGGAAVEDVVIESVTLYPDDMATNGGGALAARSATKSGDENSNVAMVGTEHKMVICGGQWLAGAAGKAAMRIRLEVAVSLKAT